MIVRSMDMLYAQHLLSGTESWDWETNLTGVVGDMLSSRHKLPALRPFQSRCLLLSIGPRLQELGQGMPVAHF